MPGVDKIPQSNFRQDDELIKFLQRAVGYSLTGYVSEQCLFILIGTGANGKSTFLNVLQSLMGDYAGTIPMQSLMDQRNGSQTNDLAYLVGKRLVVASEGERGHKIAESEIKMMTGSDRISCRALYKDLFEFEPHFKLWLATNNLPTISGMDDAIWRRIRVIEFPVQIPLEQQDKTLADRLVKELPESYNGRCRASRKVFEGRSVPTRTKHCASTTGTRSWQNRCTYHCKFGRSLYGTELMSS